MKPLLSELAIFFRDAHWPTEIERRPTFFSIAGFPHYENVMSNIYQFFFSSDNQHGLGSMCVDALLDAIKDKQIALPWSDQAFRRVYAIRELGMNYRQRLDLLLHNGADADSWREASAAILIENKVYHWLANDLPNYWDSINSPSLLNQKLGVVLGLHSQELPAHWVYITHAEWATAVERRLGFMLYRAEPRYVTLLLELIENIRTMTNTNESFKDLFIFFQEHRSFISRAEKIRGDAMQQLPAVLKAALSPNYEVSSSAEGNREGWLWITKPGNHPLRYVLGYYKIFHSDEEAPNYNIAQIISNHEHSDAERWRNELALTPEASSRQLEPYDRHYVLGKKYQLFPADYHRLPQLIADNIRTDWQPLERHWMNSNS